MKRLKEKILPSQHKGTGGRGGYSAYSNTQRTFIKFDLNEQ